MSIGALLERRHVEGAEEAAGHATENAMSYATRKDAWRNELWNVSLLPTVKVADVTEPPRGPGPAGGKALATPALLSTSVLDDVEAPAQPWAA